VKPDIEIPSLAKELVEFVGPASIGEAHREAWQRLHATHAGHETVYASPAFFETLVETQPAGSLQVAFGHSTAPGGVSAIAVLRMREQLLDPHGLAGIVLRSRIRMWALSGSEPLLAPARGTADGLASFLCGLADAPGSFDAFELQSVEVGSLPWKAVTESDALRRKFLVYMPNGVRACHLTPLPESIEAYLAQFPRKKRYNLQRQLRQIAENLGGEAVVVPLDTEASIDELTEAVRLIDADEALLLSKAEYVALARQGLLLNFVVRAGGQPVAVIVGIPTGTTYRINKVMYAHRLSPYSPGTSTLHLMNEWFIADGRFRQLDFGFGEPARSYSSSNKTVDRARVLLLRRTLFNRIRLAAHRAILAFERFARQALKRIQERRENLKAAKEPA
jgi:CelD/BcsL family acetyltransferase involved in cellulose biosynthesis